ncbi:MAG: RNA polymerase sigma factor RpoH [Magnetovibrio sp.]|nr:RNA polymerase sigma factor RpoH [Magnetovibrio sp.]
MTNIALPTVPTEGGLSQYFRQVSAFPLREQEEEQFLALRLRDQGDVSAAHELVTSHLRLVCKIAMGYRGYGLPVADLISEGNIGLMKAVKKFDPDKGFRLSTYAMWWIKAAITEYVLKSWSLVKLGTVASQKKLFFSLRNLKKRLDIADTAELSLEDAERIAEVTHVSAADVQQINRRIGGRDLSLNAPMSTDEDSMEFQDALVDESATPEQLVAGSEEADYRQDVLMRVLDSLSERDRHIFMERRLSEDPMTLEELGKVYGISRERVRQLEARAFDKVARLVKSTVAAERADAPFLDMV